jgi:protein SCO1/2
MGSIMLPGKSRLVLLVSLAILAGVLSFFAVRHSTSPEWASIPPEVQAILWPAARDIADFSQLDQRGRTFSKADLHGHWSLLYFGYLQCPDICPTTLRSLSQMRALMVEAAADADMPSIIFVSVDPSRDTPARIASYLAFFDEALIGLSGTPADLDALAGSIGIAHAENVEATGVRTMDHTTSVIVVDPQGRAVAALPAPHHAPEMLQQFNALRAFLAR